MREQREIVGPRRARHLPGLRDGRRLRRDGRAGPPGGGADVCGRAPSAGRPTSPGAWARAGRGRRSARTTSCRTRRAYAETCAAIGGLMWNWRLLAVEGEGRYADWMEAALYNGILSGISLDGRTYFYQNPLADRGGHRRQPWFGTACCPPNIARHAALPAGVPVQHVRRRGVGAPLRRRRGGGGRARVARAGDAGGARRATPGTVRCGWRCGACRPEGDRGRCTCACPAGATARRVRVNGEPAGIEERPGTYAALRRRVAGRGRGDARPADAGAVPAGASPRAGGHRPGGPGPGASGLLPEGGRSSRY